MPNLNGLLRATFFVLFGLVLCWNGNAVILDDSFPGLDDNFPGLDDNFPELDDDFLEPKPASNSSATTTKPASNSSAKPISTTSAPKVNVGGAVLGVLGVVSGGAMMYDSIDAKEEKTTWKDVAIGAGGGATAAAGTTAVFNAIPVFGQVAYGSMVAVGTVLGASGALLKMFSETDCPRDPVTGQLSCCNISNLTNLKGARRADIGDEMFGEFPYVHTCMQGKNKVKSKGPAGWIRDDHWSEKGEVKFCSGWVMPVDGDYNIQLYGSSEQEGKVCWQWECADKGMRRQGGKCVAASDTSGANATGTEKSGQGTKQNQPAQTKSGDAGKKAGKNLRDSCLQEDLPPNAKAGRYVYINAQNPVKCAATACKDGYYLVRNAEGKSQGWCKYGTDPYATTNASETTSEQGAKQTTIADEAKKAGKNLRDSCLQEDLPPNAKAGRYVYINAQNPVKCAATECNDGYYLVRNAEGKSQGWCQYGKDPYATTNASETTSEQGAKQTTIADEAKKAGKDYYDPCLPKHFPSHATAGRYIYKNAQEPFVCAATACKDGYYLVRNAEGKSQGWCKYGKDPYATTNASETKPEQGASSSDASGTGTFAQNQPSDGTSGQAQSTASVEEKSPCELNQSGWLWFEGECITDAQHQNILAKRQAAKVRALAQKIESTASQLDSISSKFKVSVWKDAEGKFNTARLASDSIAGVVLGTAGGLITSHVVKKNQVENGFQDIKCTIGGQSVANWGDEFSVGIQ